MEDQVESSSSSSLPEAVSHHSSITAHNAGVANVPQIIGCNTQGSVSISIETHIHTTANANQTHQPTSTEPSNIVCNHLKRVSNKLKSNLKMRFMSIYEGLAQRGNPTPIRNIYTELYITEGERDSLNMEHEIWQIDKAVNKQPEQDIPISCNNIFKPVNRKGLERQNTKAENPIGTKPAKCDKDEERPPRTVLTKGVAGIGKTVTVQKFILDWAEGEANQDIDLVLVLPFRELNSVKEEKQSFHELLLDFHSELQGFEDTKYYEGCKIVFIFDGLDESQLLLHFGQRRISNVSKVASLDQLMTNLIEGNLLPSALVWITSRPAAVDKIPQELIHRMTEIQGFTDLQKEEYFRKRIRNPSLADNIISHVKQSRTLEIMCHIPVFCWITATVLEKLLSGSNTNISLSLTELYTRFLLIQINEKNKKYHRGTQINPLVLCDADFQLILDLAKLAFDKLEKNNIVFSEDDLKKYGIDVTEASVWSGVFTEIVKKEDPMFSEKMYSFVHLSFQEYLAAFFVFCTYALKRENILQSRNDKSSRTFMWYDNWDDEYYFEDNKSDYDQEVTLYDLQKCAVDRALRSKNGHLDLFLRFFLGLSMESSQKLLRNISLSEQNKQNSINKTIQYLKGKLREEDDRNVPSSERCINLFQCLLELDDHSMAEEIKRFLTSGRQAQYKLTAAQCSTLSYIILMSGEVLEELDLNKYNTTEEGQRRLVPAARNSKKALMADCKLTPRCCETLASVIQNPDAHLRELDISCRALCDTSLTALLAGLNSPHCRLETLNLSHINLEKKGADVLRAILMGPHRQPATLKLYACNVKDDCAETLASALGSADSRLRELDLSYNSLTSDGLNHVLQGLLSPCCNLNMLRLSGSRISVDGCMYLGSALRHSSMRELILDSSSIGDAGAKHLCIGLMSPHCQLQTLGLRDCKLSKKSCSYLTVALCTYSVVKKLNLGDNDLQDSGVKLLSVGLKTPNCILQSLGLSGCMITVEGCASLASALSSNPSHLKELDLSYNHPGDSGVKLLSARLEDPHCRLETLKLDHRGRSRLAAGLWKYHQDINMDDGGGKVNISGDRKGAIRLSPNETPYYDSDDEVKVDPPKWAAVSCSEGLAHGRFYWEVVWTGMISIEVKYRGEFFGKALKLICNRYQYCALHEDKFCSRGIFVTVPKPDPQRVGVLLDWPAGTMSLYSISTDGVSRLHTFHTTFEKPVYPQFSFALPDLCGLGSVIIVTQSSDSGLHTKTQLFEQIMSEELWYSEILEYFPCANLLPDFYNSIF